MKRFRFRRSCTVALAAATVLMVPTTDARAALVSMVSDALSGKPVPDFEGETLDGTILRSADFHDQAVVVNFLASWSPVYQGETQDLRKLHAQLASRGVRFIGVLVDPLEMIIPAPYYRKFAGNRSIKVLITGVTPAATGAIAGATFVLGRRAIIDGQTLLICIVALLLLTKVRNGPEPSVILAVGVVGLIVRGGFGP